ncbi:Hypothetical protein CAP_4086 [Chondromyces apiculatus DSM 436]|uniref:Protein kinase domain-containing protein n=2 Tax=Chondromyces apiculatus TaxID=51 RepID=A0A017TIZ3_9BACT|nr:Hypothetical protein CAP_4086 [Chondromyces apiculatus DSM 436]
MGSLWVADHQMLGIRVAVKFMSPQVAAEPDLVARFQQEARAAARIRSPHVAQVFDHGVVDDGSLCIVMELLEGESLGRRLARVGTLPPEEVTKIVVQAARGLGKAHRVGVIHRDIKPDNLFLTDVDGELFVKLLDFGVAKQRSGDGDTGMTATGIMLGTPLYMSPEQFVSAKHVGPQADLWALGAVAYHALTGKLPFSGKSLGALAVAVNEGKFTPPSAVNAGLPQAIDVWMAKALQVDPARRFASAGEMADAFVEAVRGPGVGQAGGVAAGGAWAPQMAPGSGVQQVSHGGGALRASHGGGALQSSHGGGASHGSGASHGGGALPAVYESDEASDGGVTVQMVQGAGAPPAAQGPVAPAPLVAGAAAQASPAGTGGRSDGAIDGEVKAAIAAWKAAQGPGPTSAFMAGGTMPVAGAPPGGGAIAGGPGAGGPGAAFGQAMTPGLGSTTPLGGAAPGFGGTTPFAGAGPGSGGTLDLHGDRGAGGGTLKGFGATRAGESTLRTPLRVAAIAVGVALAIGGMVLAVSGLVADGADSGPEGAPSVMPPEAGAGPGSKGGPQGGEHAPSAGDTAPRAEDGASAEPRQGSTPPGSAAPGSAPPPAGSASAQPGKAPAEVPPRPGSRRKTREDDIGF